MKTIFSKEDCQDYVDEIRYCLDYHEADTSIYDALKVLEHIMIDYFDNPPLKFEELKPGMWVWDNKWKTYYTIGKFRNKNIYARYVRFVVDPYTDEQKVDNNGWMGVFEENRFYRHEVKEVKE